ncbi:hypothetical protein [Euzebya sp.]|uniref:hypothetical protein n=1 Tax=Euzebya sp. TaxID=1971409 RepID=UPI00351527AB
MRRRAALTASVAIGVLVVLALAGQGRLSGPILVSVTSRHGIHLGDLLVVLAGVTAIAAVIRLARR